MSSERDATVIGAGIVGVCCALYLQRAGLKVRLIDRGAPGEGVIPRMLEAQTTDVDAVSGATNSSRVIQKAVETALLAP